MDSKREKLLKEMLLRKQEKIDALRDEKDELEHIVQKLSKILDALLFKKEED